MGAHHARVLFDAEGNRIRSTQAANLPSVVFDLGGGVVGIDAEHLQHGIPAPVNDPVENPVARGCVSDSPHTAGSFRRAASSHDS